MDAVEPRLETTLRDIGFLYVSCGHLADGVLTMDEMRLIGKLVKSWQPDLSEDLMAEVIKAAVADYGALDSIPDRLKATRECARRLKQALPKATLVDLVGDLDQIVEADGRVLKTERSFVAAAAQVFGVSHH